MSNMIYKSQSSYIIYGVNLTQTWGKSTFWKEDGLSFNSQRKGVLISIIDEINNDGNNYNLPL